MGFQNVYEDEARAASYARLGFPGTYYLAYSDLPAILRRHAPPGGALDFGCGTGRSTRFLREQGYDALGVDISERMIAQARALDPAGEYRLVRNGCYETLGEGIYALILAVFTFDNIPDTALRATILSGLRRLLRPDGVIVLVDSTPELYVHDWASFSCTEFAYNHTARSGELVSTRMRDVDDARPVDDILWTHEDYLSLFQAARLRPVETLRPLGDAAEPFDWVNETRIPPWVIYVLKAAARPRARSRC